MALTVSQAFKDTQKRRGRKKARVLIKYKRRYFDPGTVNYVYEPNWQTLTMRDVVDPGEIIHQLDVTDPGIFKSSTVTIRLKNTQNEWHASVNDPSIFAADALAVNGYDDARVLFQITDGLQLPDGTWEDLPQFTGYSMDFKPDPLSGYMEIPISATLLADACRAVEINVPVTGEAVALSAAGEEMSPYTGDGTTALLKTKSTGVIFFVALYATNPSTGAKTTLTPTTDYTVSIPTDGTEAKVTLVSPASWNGKNFTADVINKDLLSASQGVVSVTALYADGAKLVQGADYTLSLPQDVAPAKMTLADPELWIGKAFTWDGTKGRTNLTVEQAVALFCDAAGITSSMRSIIPVIFPGGLGASKTIDSQADWNAGTLLQNLDTATVPGSILRGWFLIDDFSDGDYTINPVWTTAVSGGSVSVSSGNLVVAATLAGGGMARAWTPLAKSYGAWSWKSSVSGSGAFVYFSCTGTDPLSSGGTGYYLQFYTGAPYGSGVHLYRVEPSSADVLLGSYTGAGYDGLHVWTVTRDSAGSFVVFMDGVQVITATDATWTTADSILIEANGNPCTISITDIYYSAQSQPGPFTLSNADAVGEWQFDLLTTPVVLGTMDVYSILNGGTVVIKTATAPDAGGVPGAYDPMVALSAANLMMSTPQRWLKIRAEITPAAGSLTTPELQKLVAHFTSSNVTLSLVAPTSGTAFQYIQKYAGTCHYETGVDEAGILFFRPRTVSGSAVLDLTPWTNLSKVDNTSKGFDKVFTVVHVTASPYDYYYDSAAAGEAEPTSARRFGPVQRDIDLSGILFANDVEIGQASAQAGWEDLHLPKWSCRAIGKAAAWAQLSDPVNLTAVPDPKMIDNAAGDPYQAPGFAGAAGVALAISKRMKIVGVTRNLGLRQHQYLLQELLS